MLKTVVPVLLDLYLFVDKVHWHKHVQGDIPEACDTSCHKYPPDHSLDRYTVQADGQIQHNSQQYIPKRK